MNDLDKLMLEKLKYQTIVRKSYNKVTKSYRKGRAMRVQQIFDKNGFVVKQIIHNM